jgi:hypothetical protein
MLAIRRHSQPPALKTLAIAALMAMRATKNWLWRYKKKLKSFSSIRVNSVFTQCTVSPYQSRLMSTNLMGLNWRFCSFMEQGHGLFAPRSVRFTTHDLHDMEWAEKDPCIFRKAFEKDSEVYELFPFIRNIALRRFGMRIQDLTPQQQIAINNHKLQNLIMIFFCRNQPNEARIRFNTGESFSDATTYS